MLLAPAIAFLSSKCTVFRLLTKVLASLDIAPCKSCISSHGWYPLFVKKGDISIVLEGVLL